MTIDVTTGEVKTIVPQARGPLRQWPAITSQAWAPDDRRIVYTNNDGIITMLDLVTLAETSLGPGGDATWSADGQWIVARVSTGKNLEDAEYVLIHANPPHARRKLLADATLRWNPLSALRWTRVFIGPALWSPDSRSLVLWRLKLNEREEPYVLDRTTGSLERLPKGYWIRSLRGPP